MSDPEGASAPRESIRACDRDDFQEILEIVNAAAEAYRGVIPEDRWSEPYMTSRGLAGEIADGVRFRGWEEGGRLLGVMGIQAAGDVTLIRHAYVRPDAQGRGVGSALLRHLVEASEGPCLVGTWAAATWAVRFYEGHGFRLVDGDEKDALLRRYWSIPERQVDTSVVLVGPGWRKEER